MRKRKHNGLACAPVQCILKGMARQRRQGQANSRSAANDDTIY
jgi:hypothetical protein